MEYLVLLSIYDLLLSVGIVQGLLSGFLVLFSKNKHLSVVVLGIIMVVCSLVNLKYVAHVNSFSIYEKITFLHSNVLIFLLLWPLVYLYVLSILQNDFKIKIIFILHFIPSFVYFICGISSYVEFQNYHHFTYTLYISVICPILKNPNFESLLSIISCVVYIYLILLKLKQHGLTKIIISFSTTHVVCHWIRIFIISMLLLTFIYIYNLQLYGYEKHLSENAFGWRFFHVLILFFVYYHGFIGLRRPGFDLYSSIVSMQSKDKKSQRVNVDSIKIALVKKLEEEEVYLNPNLSISELAEKLKVSSENLSFVINHEFSLKFRDYINSYRIEAAKLKLQNNGSIKKSILIISLDSGFNSQASFYRAFKKFEGTTPIAYIKNLQ